MTKQFIRYKIVIHRDKKIIHRDKERCFMRKMNTDTEVLLKLIAILPRLPENEQYRILGYGERMADEKEEKRAAENR